MENVFFFIVVLNFGCIFPLFNVSSSPLFLFFPLIPLFTHVSPFYSFSLISLFTLFFPFLSFFPFDLLSFFSFLVFTKKLQNYTHYIPAISSRFPSWTRPPATWSRSSTCSLSSPSASSVASLELPTTPSPTPPVGSTNTSQSRVTKYCSHWMAIEKT